MSKTLTQILTYVKYDFKRDDKDTEITQAYNDTIRHLSNLKGLEGTKFTSYINTVAGQPDYPLPQNATHIFHPVRYIESSTSTQGYPLTKRSQEEFRLMYPTPNYSGSHRTRPSDYCIYSKQLWIGPLPDLATYILEVDWAKLITEKSASSDTHELGDEWDEVIKFGILARLYEGLGFTEEADRYWALYKDDEFGYPNLLRKERQIHEAMGTVKFNDL